MSSGLLAAVTGETPAGLGTAGLSVIPALRLFPTMTLNKMVWFFLKRCLLEYIFSKSHTFSNIFTLHQAKEHLNHYFKGKYFLVKICSFPDSTTFYTLEYMDFWLCVCVFTETTTLVFFRHRVSARWIVALENFFLSHKNVEKTLLSLFQTTL